MGMFSLGHIIEPSDRLPWQQSQRAGNVQLCMYVCDSTWLRQLLKYMRWSISGAWVMLSPPHTDEPMSLLLCPHMAGFDCFCLLHVVASQLQWCYLLRCIGFWLSRVTPQTVKTHRCVCPQWDTSTHPKMTLIWSWFYSVLGNPVLIWMN